MKCLQATVSFMLLPLVTFMLLSPPVRAQIRYTDIEPDTLIADTNDIPGQYKLDLDGDGRSDYFVMHFYYPIPVYVLSIYTEYNTAHEVLLDGENSVLALAAGEPIDDTRMNWHCSASGSQSDGMSFAASWFGSGDHYIGLRVRAGEVWHYGWLRAEVAADQSSILLKDFAVHTQADTPIKAGETGMVAVHRLLAPADIDIAVKGGFVTVLLPFDIPAEITVHDIIGRERFSHRTQGMQFTMNLSGIPQGVYFLRVNFPGQTIVKRVALLW